MHPAPYGSTSTQSFPISLRRRFSRRTVYSLNGWNPSGGSSMG